MPRRGEYTEIDYHEPVRPTAVARVGVRSVAASETNGQQAVVSVNPGVFECAGLAAELADEWVELVQAAGFSAATFARTGRRFGTSARTLTLRCRRPEQRPWRGRTLICTWR